MPSVDVGRGCGTLTRVRDGRGSRASDPRDTSWCHRDQSRAVGAFWPRATRILVRTARAARPPPAWRKVLCSDSRCCPLVQSVTVLRWIMPTEAYS
jgi:hypothetical protein